MQLNVLLKSETVHIMNQLLAQWKGSPGGGLRAALARTAQVVAKWQPKWWPKRAQVVA